MTTVDCVLSPKPRHLYSNMKSKIRTSLGLFAVSAAMLFAADEYRSHTYVQLFPQQSMAVNPEFAHKKLLKGTPEDHVLQEKTILSDDILRQAVQRLVPESDADPADTIKRMRIGVEVKQVRGTDLTEIAVTSVDQEFSRKLADQLTEVYITRRKKEDPDNAPVLHEDAKIGVLVAKQNRNGKHGSDDQTSPKLMKPEFHYTILIAKPAAEVWSALTVKKTIDQYYMAPVHTLELKKGGRISYGGEKEFIFGTITEIEEPKKLVHTFEFGRLEMPETRVSYEIQPMGEEMCSLTISHTGFEAEDQAFADITGGWPVIASSLKTLLETGKGMPWPKRDGS